jgi:GDP-L-fucose synthase
MNIKENLASNLKRESILITGGAGFLGNKVVQCFMENGFGSECVRGQKAMPNNVYINRSVLFDLTIETHVSELFSRLSPTVVIHLAAAVGGIGANQKTPGSFFYKNAMMGILMQEYARRHNVKKFVTVGTVCSYPKFTTAPFKESDIWNGYPEETNAAYGIAKKSLLVQSQAYRQEYGFNGIHLLPANLYGPLDNFDDNTSHVIPAIIKRIYEAVKNNTEQVVIWGDGSPTREFLYVDDAAKGIVQATSVYDGSEPINLGTGREISIKDLAAKIAQLMDYKGQIKFDPSKPNGQPRRCLDSTQAALQFNFDPSTDLDSGLKTTIEWYIKHTSTTGANR